MNEKKVIQVRSGGMHHAVVRGDLSKFLQVYPDLDLVGEAENGAEGVQLAQRLQPDVVLMDLEDAGDGLLVTMCALREKCPQTRVIVLTSFAEDELVQGASSSRDGLPVQPPRRPASWPNASVFGLPYVVLDYPLLGGHRGAGSLR